MRALLFFLILSSSLLQADQSDSVSMNDQSLTMTSDSVLKSTIPASKSDSLSIIHDTIQLTKHDTIQLTTHDTVEALRRDTVYLEKSKEVAEKAIVKVDKKDPNPLKSIGEILSFWKIFWAIITCFIAYYFFKLLILIINSLNEKSNNSFRFLRNLGPFIKIGGWIIVTLIIVEGIFDPPRETIIAVLASAGIAIGFASQDILKNIFGGIMILVDRPFQIGDKIEVGDYYGEVVGIGLRSTRIKTKDDSLVSIPNSEVVNTAVSNSNDGENNCQVVAEIYLPIDIDTDLVRKIATETAQISRYIYLNKPITVLFFNEVKERRSYIKMRLKAYVSDLKHEFAFKSDMTEIFIKELLHRGIISSDEMQ